jgi:hypothetical protein
MKWLFGLGVVVLFVLLGGITSVAGPQTPLSLPHVDFDCDGEITVNDVLTLVPQYGRVDLPSLWAYDLDRDGKIDELDARIVVVEIGRTDLPRPVWCRYGAGVETSDDQRSNY